MGAIANGLTAGASAPTCATFFVFLDYMRPAVRLSALSGLPVIYVSRTTPSASARTVRPTSRSSTGHPARDARRCVFRPADANETVAGWQVALGP